MGCRLLAPSNGCEHLLGSIEQVHVVLRDGVYADAEGDCHVLRICSPIKHELCPLRLSQHRNRLPELVRGSSHEHSVDGVSRADGYREPQLAGQMSVLLRVLSDPAVDLSCCDDASSTGHDDIVLLPIIMNDLLHHGDGVDRAEKEHGSHDAFIGAC